MNVNNGEIRTFQEDEFNAQLQALNEQYPDTPWEQIPDELIPAARKIAEKGGKVSLTSGGKLSKWAAGQRKARRKMNKMGCK